MRAMPVTEGVYLYFIPPSTWTVEGSKQISVLLDVTYLNEENNPAVCNISFFNTRETPGEATQIAFSDGSNDYPLGNVKTMFADFDNNELRVRSVILIEELQKALRAETIDLRFTLDGTRYIGKAPKMFLVNKERFLLYNF